MNLFAAGAFFALAACRADAGNYGHAAFDLSMAAAALALHYLALKLT